jgi:hypothetical protein
MASGGDAADDGLMDTLMLLMVPFGSLAVLAVAGAAKAGTKAVDAEDSGRRFELWGLCAALTLVAALCMAAAWWWWQGWQDFGF